MDAVLDELLVWERACFQAGSGDEIAVWALMAQDVFRALPRGVLRVWPPAVLLLGETRGGLRGDLPRVSLLAELPAWLQDEPRAERLPVLPRDELQADLLQAGS